MQQKNETVLPEIVLSPKGPFSVTSPNYLFSKKSSIQMNNME